MARWRETPEGSPTDTLGTKRAIHGETPQACRCQSYQNLSCAGASVGQAFQDCPDPHVRAHLDRRVEIRMRKESLDSFNAVGFNLRRFYIPYKTIDDTAIDFPTHKYKK